MCSPYVAGVAFCTLGETVKVELIQLIPPGKFGSIILLSETNNNGQ